MHKPPRHRPRRPHPAELLQPVLELTVEERLARYWDRYRVLAHRAEQHHEALVGQAVRLNRAAEALVGAPMGCGPVDLLARAVARYCWTAPSAPRPPAVFAGHYFETPRGALHWLDLHSSILRDALDHELRRRHRAAPPPGDNDVLMLADFLWEALAADPIGTSHSYLFHRVLDKLIARAHAEGPAARTATGRLARLGRALLPDGRAYRPRRAYHRLAARSRERIDGLTRLNDAVQEEQRNFSDYCGVLDQTMLPPPLRVGAPHILPEYVRTP